LGFLDEDSYRIGNKVFSFFNLSSHIQNLTIFKIIVRVFTLDKTSYLKISLISCSANLHILRSTNQIEPRRQNNPQSGIARQEETMPAKIPSSFLSSGLSRTPPPPQKQHPKNSNPEFYSLVGNLENHEPSRIIRDALVDVFRIVEDGKGAVLDRISAGQVVEGTGDEECLGAQGSWRLSVKVMNK
jgi:hypothetical protein